MYSIRLDVNDNILDKVMFFLENIPKISIKVEKISDKVEKSSNMADFFQNSPLVDANIKLKRDDEKYQDRFSF